MHWGEVIPPGKVTAHDITPYDRPRLGAPAPGEDGRWFRFDDGTPTTTVAEDATSMLEEAEQWWNSV